MASTINASTSAGLVSTADTSGVLQLQTAGTTAVSIDASQAVTFSAGTANGVAYLNGSKVLTTGSALTFDGNYFTAASGTGSFLADILQVSGTATKVNANGVGLELRGSATPNITAYNRVTSAYLPMTLDTSASIFSISGTEGMRLASTGLLVGTTSNPQNSKLMVGGTVQVKPAANNSLEIIGPNSGTGIRLFARNDAGTLNRLELQGGQVIFPLTSGADGLYFDATSGNLGIGTTSPSTYGKIVSSGGTFSLVTDTSAQRRLSFWSTGNGNSENAYIQVQNDGATTNTGEMLFATKNSGGTLAERMRLDASGNLLVGKTAASDTTVGFTAYSNGTVTTARSSSNNGDLNLYVYSTGAAAARFYVGMGGTVYATSTTITAISDQRLKENIQDIDVGLDKIMALKPRKFDWKAGKGKDIKGDRGWIAQEFEEVFPDMIDTWADPAPEGEDPYKAVNADLIPVLVKAIQELKAEVDSLKSQLEAK
jgi:hypothetical protein